MSLMTNGAGRAPERLLLYSEFRTEQGWASMTPRGSDPHYAVGAASDWLPLGIWLDQSGSADVSHDAGSRGSS